MLRNINKFNLVIAIGWVIYMHILVLLDVGEYTKGPFLITLWDAIWIPTCCATFPILIGMSLRNK